MEAEQVQTSTPNKLLMIVHWLPGREQSAWKGYGMAANTAAEIQAVQRKLTCDCEHSVIGAVSQWPARN